MALSLEKLLLNPKFEYRNSKWFGQLTTLSKVEGQIPIPMTKIENMFRTFEI
jgi:hypothetical protein